MAQLSIQIPHNLGREEVTRRIKEKISLARSQVIELDEKWQDNTLAFRFEAMGLQVGGKLEVEDAAVNLKLDLPLAAMMFKGVIEQRVRQEVTGLLA